MHQLIFLTLLGSIILHQNNVIFCKLSGPKKLDFCHDADAIVIGAGMSGITAARELSRNGIGKFLILEGSNSVGGRIINVKLGETNIELGPNWIHGTTNNPIFELAKKYKLKGQFEDPESVICKDENGKDVTQEFLTVRRNLKRMLINQTGFPKSSLSIREALDLDGWRNDSTLKNMAEISLIDFMDAVSPDLKSASLENPSKIDSLYDKQFFITDPLGYKKIIHGMLGEFLGNDTSKLKLNHFVEKIHWNKHGVRVATQNGNFFTARILIITCSIGVLQNSQNLFVPRLPVWKKQALAKLKMTTYTKIFVQFPYRFWDNVEYIFYASQNRGYFPVWQSLDASSRFENETNIILMTVTESESLRIESLKKELVVQEIMEVLRKVYGKHIPEPLDIVIPKWSSNPLYFGSYSYLPVNVSHMDFVALRGAVGPLLFAGSASHEVYQGYLHGAYFEGKNRAQDALQVLKRSRDTSMTDLDYDYYDDCLRDACNCCYK